MGKWHFRGQETIGCKQLGRTGVHTHIDSVANVVLYDLP